jgi:protein-tyrosine phosphatase
MAEAVFSKMVAEAGLADRIRVDSAGTGGWHSGEPAHEGTRDVLRRRGIAYRGRARQIGAEDVKSADTWLIAMDNDNLTTLRRRFGDLPRLHRLMEFATRHTQQNVPDPYYNNQFDLVYTLVEDGCRGLLHHLQQELDKNRS